VEVNLTDIKEILGFLPNMQLMSISYLLTSDCAPGYSLTEGKTYRDEVHDDRFIIEIEFVNDDFIWIFSIDYTGAVMEKKYARR
jgi:hypothetical protein